MSPPPAPSPDPKPPAVAAGGLSADRVPFWEKVAFALGEPASNMGGWLPTTMANQVFNMTLGVSPAMISLAFMCFRFWDAITDVLMGWISDNFRSRWGRRRPFIFTGAILGGLLFPVMWMVGRDWGEMGILGWFVGWGLLFYTCFTVYTMPYHSLILEMTPHYHERTVVNAYRAMAGKLWGLAGGWIWAVTRLPIFTDEATGRPDTLLGMQAVSLVVGVIILGLGLMPALFTRERYYGSVGKKKVPLWAGMRATVTNRPFLLLAGLVVMMTLGNACINNFATYVQTYHIYGGDQTMASLLFGWSQTAAMTAGLAAIPVFTAIAKRLGKTRCLLILLLSKLVLAISSWFLYNPRWPYLSVIPAVLGVPVQSALWMILPSMLADVVDHDELATGQRREGNFTAVFSWLIKASQTVGLGASGFMLVLTGFEAEHGAQPEEVLTRMRLILAVLPACSLAGSLLLLRLYPITAPEAQRLREQLEARRGAIR